jgi:hypothetical protein
MKKTFQGTIRNWKEVLVSKASGATVIIGEPGEDNRFRGYDMMRTSVVVKMNKAKTKVETLNSVYKLENPK